MPEVLTVALVKFVEKLTELADEALTALKEERGA